MTPHTTIPVTIITGFLGAGKTTLLNRLLTAEHQLRIAVLVNDFGTINIDSQLVVDVDAATDSIALSNGCICCTIRGELIESVERLASSEPPPDLIVIETSGISDPIDVVLALRALTSVHVDSVMTLIDAEQVLNVGKVHQTLVWNQIGTADFVILNKVDLIDAAQRTAVHAYIKHIAPKTRMIETTHGDVPHSVIWGGGAVDLERLRLSHNQTDHTERFKTWAWQHDEPLSLVRIQHVLERLPTHIYRAKGVFYTSDHPQQRTVVQVVGKRVTMTTDDVGRAENQASAQLVVIGDAAHWDEDGLAQYMSRALTSDNIVSSVTRFVEKIALWRR